MSNPTSNQIINKSTIPGTTLTEALQNVALMGGDGTGDMLKSIYDTNNNGKVDISELAESVDYPNITNKPSTFPPMSHSHAVSEVVNLQSTLDTKVDKVAGKGLSTEDYTTVEKSKLAVIAAGATANQADAYLLSRANHTGTQALSTLSQSGATNGQVATWTGSAWVPQTPSGGGGGSGNAIINGDFSVNQRGPTSVTVSSGYPSGGKLVDMWGYGADAGASGSFTVSQQAHTLGQTDVPGAVYFYRTATSSFVAGTNGFLYIGRHAVEDVRTYAGQQVVLSFSARASAAAPVRVNVAQWFGSGGSAITHHVSPVLNLTTAYQRFSVPLTLSSLAGKTIGGGSALIVELFAALKGTAASAYGVSAFDCLATGNYDISDVQLELGTVASPFDRRPHDLELLRCRRFYRKNGQVTGTVAPNGTGFTFTESFDSQMRAAPTITLLTSTPYIESPVFSSGFTASAASIYSTHSYVNGVDVFVEGFSGLTALRGGVFFSAQVAYTAEL